ncbi:DUF3754 domain-containing protein [Myxococcota bacterium]|nr:DUF3754 domain-containing protein [Myxococcota bacterium]MBU1534741.1 DUF3754 domain-containing protein [Myxococcota bacterium]
MTAPVSEHFIPYRKKEILEMILADGPMGEDERARFEELAILLQSLYHFSFHQKVESLKNNYFPFSADDEAHFGSPPSPETLERFEQDLLKEFREVLKAANYEELGDEALSYAQKEQSLFHINVYIKLDDFKTYLMYSRGERVIRERVRRLVFFKREIDVPIFERIVLLIHFKKADHFSEKARLPFEPGSMIIKLFKNIPKADIEMLFPNARVRMKVRDKLFMGVPALGGGVWVLLKTFTGLVAFFVVLGAMIANFFTGGSFRAPTPQQMAQIIGGLASLAVLGAFVFKQWSKYKNRKILFMKALGESLYYKNLDSNAGVFHHLIDSAEEEENKEAILAYYFLLRHPRGLSQEALDQAVERWFLEKHGTTLNFEVDDALGKLIDLGICEQSDDPEPLFTVVPVETACEILDYRWDNYFSNNRGSGGEST